MASSISISILFFLSLLFQVSSGLAENNGCIKAIYSFGDSIADTGNLLREGPAGISAPMARLPYGETFGKPTGRSSDGLLMIDYLAMALSLPLIEPYLDKGASFDHGVNFAVAGATALDAPFFLSRGITLPVTSLSLSVQLGWFKTYLNSTCTSQRECAKKLEQALFLVGEIGGNDYNYALFQGRSIEEVMSYVPHVVENIKYAAKELIDAGANQLVVPGNFPIGCTPSYLTIFRSIDPKAYDANNCLKDLNSFAMMHNKQLQAALKELRQENPHVLIMYADYYQAFMHLLTKASNLGFDEDSLLKACCGMGGDYNFDLNWMCGVPGAWPCLEPARRVSWDGIHLTQEAYKVMAQSLMTKEFTYPSYGVPEKWKCE